MAPTHQSIIGQDNHILKISLQLKSHIRTMSSGSKRMWCRLYLESFSLSVYWGMGHWWWCFWGTVLCEMYRTRKCIQFLITLVEGQKQLIASAISQNNVPGICNYSLLVCMELSRTNLQRVFANRVWYIYRLKGHLY